MKKVTCIQSYVINMIIIKFIRLYSCVCTHFYDTLNKVADIIIAKQCKNIDEHPYTNQYSPTYDNGNLCYVCT